jgi:hypothetical protein
MHIVSKFHDYYDSAMGLGVDKALVYKRVQEPGDYITDAPRWSYDVREETHRVGYSPSDTISIKSWVVPLIFCGTFYRRAIADVTYRNPNRHAMPYHVTDRYTAGSRKDVLARVYAEHRLTVDTEQKPRYSRWYHKDDRRTFREYAETHDWIPDHIREGCPVFSIRGLTHEEAMARHGRRWNEDAVFRIEKNPSLKELGFFQVKTPFEAFQEIAMFLGGVMGTDARPMVQLSDKEVHQKHGYDKWSFRKMPEAD